MKIYRNKVWTVLNIGLFKGACLLLGMIAGGYLSGFTRRHVRSLACLALLLALAPAFAYFRDEDAAEQPG